MKYLLILGGLALIYYFIARNAPVKPVAEAVTARGAVPLSTGPRLPAPPVSSAPASTALKRPLDRTRSVLDQVRQRNGAGEF